MRMLIATTLISIGLGVGGACAADGCGPGCHSTVQGECVVDGWQNGARVRNECPAGAHATPPCGPNYSWVRQARMCLLVH